MSAENEAQAEPAALSVAERIARSWDATMEGALAAAVAHPNADVNERPALVKQVRKATKTGRALVRLVASAVAPEVRNGAERYLRDAASLLSPIRDRDAMIDTVHGLLDGKLDERAQQAKLLLASVVIPPSVGDDQAAFEVALVRRAAALLSRASDLIRTVPPEKLTPQITGDAIGKLWRKACRRANRACDPRSDRCPIDSLDSDSLHEVRKMCSRIVHQLNLIEDDLSKPLRSFRQRLRKANSSLGDDRDLTLLGECIALHRERLGPTFADAVLGVCQRAQVRLRHQARATLAEAMTMRPRELSRRIARRFDS
jgi:CHAD domain-containing protein